MVRYKPDKNRHNPMNMNSTVMVIDPKLWIDTIHYSAAGLG